MASRVAWGLGALALVVAVVATLLGVESLHYPIAITALVTIVGGHLLAAWAERERDLDDYILSEERAEQGLPAVPERSIGELVEQLRIARRWATMSIVVGLLLAVAGILLSPLGLSFVGAFGQWIAVFGMLRHFVARLEAGSLATIARERKEREETGVAAPTSSP